MLSLFDIEQRLKIYREFLHNPPEMGSFTENSYERRAYRIALYRTLEDAERLLKIVQALTRC